MLYSYDIFDTILYRKLPRSIDIFHVMEDKDEVKRIWGNSSMSFSKCRQYSEFVLRRFSKRELTIDRIYGEIAKRNTYIRTDIEKLIGLELQTERENTFLNRPLCDEIRSLINNGDRVVLISDMYWSAQRIRDILAEKAPIFSDIPIYVSCEYDASKKNGTLFEVVRENERADYNDWRHTGDNACSDYSVPAALGITCQLVKAGRHYSFEKKLLSLDADALKLYGLIAETRLNSTGDAYDLGVSFAAPMVYMYVEWVLKRAEKEGITKLYFVLRDGYILKQVADIIIKKRGLAISTDYVFGSRVAWRLPMVDESSIRKLSVWEKGNWIFRYPAHAYVPFERLGFLRTDLENLFGKNFCDRTLSSFNQFKETLSFALDNELFREKLKINVKKARENLILYFSQVIDWKSSFAFVDTNSTGKSQNDLNCIFCDKGKAIRFFYHTYLGEKIDEETQLAFNFSGTEDRDDRIPEALFRAPYQQCYGYLRREDGVAYPTFVQREYNAWNDRFDYDEYLSGICAFTNALEDNLSACNEHIDVTEYAKLLMRVANFDLKSDDVMSQIGAIPFNPDLDGNECRAFYPRLSVSALLHPFTQLIYYPKGSFHISGGLWKKIYCLLYWLVRKNRHRKQR